MKNEDGIWRTIGGRRIFIKEGQDLETAMRDSGKFKLKGNSKENISKKTQKFGKDFDKLEKKTNQDYEEGKIDKEQRDKLIQDNYDNYVDKYSEVVNQNPYEYQDIKTEKEDMPKGSLKDYANDLAKNYMIQEEYDDKETPRYIQDIDAGRYGNMTDEEAIKNWLAGADLIYDDDARELLEKNGIEVEDDDPYATYTNHLSKELLNNYKADKERLQNSQLSESQKDAMLDKLRNKDMQLQKPMSARDFAKNTNDLANEAYDGKITRDEYARKYDDLKHTMESQNENVNKYTEGKVDDTNLLKNANVNKNINDSKDRLIKEQKSDNRKLTNIDNKLSKEVYDFDKDGAWSNVGKASNSRGDSYVRISKNGESTKTSKDMIDYITSKHPELKVVSDYGNEVWFMMNNQYDDNKRRIREFF